MPAEPGSRGTRRRTVEGSVGTGRPVVGSGGRICVGNAGRAPVLPGHRRTSADGGDRRPGAEGTAAVPDPTGPRGRRPVGSPPGASGPWRWTPRARTAPGRGRARRRRRRPGRPAQSSADREPAHPGGDVGQQHEGLGDVVRRPPPGRRPAGRPARRTGPPPSPRAAPAGAALSVVTARSVSQAAPSAVWASMVVERLHDQRGVGAGGQHGLAGPRRPGGGQGGHAVVHERAHLVEAGAGEFEQGLPRASPARASWVCSVPRLTS